MRATLIAIFFAAGLAGCSVNPVTGRSELLTVSEADEISIGDQQYAPMQQAQGGVYDVDPALTAYVKGVGDKLAAVSDRPLPYEFVVLNNSVPNAWALPGGKIAINRGLLVELENEAELAAVLGHEIVHAAARHSAKQLTRSALSQVLVVATAAVSGGGRYGDLAVGSAAAGAQLLNSAYGRGAELESDLYGMRYMSAAGYDPSGAISLQETFVKLSEGGQQDWLSGLFASHPPSQDRVDANRRTAAELPAGGDLGVESFQLAIQKTLAAKPAYDAYEKGRAALADGDQDDALAFANEALDMFSDEAHFHALRGDVRLVQENYDWAVTNYTRAIDRREAFFYYHLQRGLANRELDKDTAAFTDLERSVELLPTAPAHFALGSLAEERGNYDDAIEHYRVVAKSGGDYGKAATAALAKLDLPQNPASYIPRRCGADSNGNLVVSVQNQVNVTIAGVQVAVQYTDAAGRTQRSVHAIRGNLAPGEVASVNTGLGPYTGGSCPAEVVAARIVE